MEITNLDDSLSFKEFISSPKLSVIHFHADWAEQCKPMDLVMKEIAKQETTELQYARCPAEELPELSLKYKITAVPTFLFFKSSEIVDRLEGANPPELNNKITKLANVKITPVSKSKEELDRKLKALIDAAPVMLFMKGNSNQPKCGFSKTIVNLLDSLNTEYKTFDILFDDEVRQGLKTYSDWPTFPQLYIDGEFIGGLDIVKELHNNGDLDNLLPKKKDLNSRLKSLTTKSKIMVFMKGNRENPKCGFSRQLMEIFQELKVEFETFDILTDEEVRQGLKSYSDWPTYPQVYVKGELIGGLDIIQELRSSGELLKTLNPPMEQNK